MGSANKISFDNISELSKWLTQNTSSTYVVSDKLDGVSGLLVKKYDEIKLYTRGKGEVGTDISHLVPYLKLSQEFLAIDYIAVRGELIFKKELFNQKYKDRIVGGEATNRNARNTIAGFVNAKTIDMEKAQDINYVMYEIVDASFELPSILIQLNYLQSLNADVVWYEEIPIVNKAVLSTTLRKRKEESEYQIDGIIIQHNNQYVRNTSGNPTYMFAYKETLESDIHITTILRIEWTLNKSFEFIPVAVIKPVYLEGNTLRRATCNNAKYIFENDIGEGTVIKIIRSKDVIPKIIEVVSSTHADMPTEEWKWDKNGTHVIAVDMGNEENAQNACVKLLSSMFSKLDIKYVSEKRIETLYVNGLNTFLKIIKAPLHQIKAIKEFRGVQGDNIYMNIHEKLQDVSVEKLLGASLIFTKIVAEERIRLVLQQYPDIFIRYKTMSKNQLKFLLLAIRGIGEETATCIVNGIEGADRFLQEVRPYIKFETKPLADVQDLKGETIVFTGFRDAKLQDALIARGARITTSVSGKTTLVVANSEGDKKTGSGRKAGELNIRIMLRADFVSDFFPDGY